MVKSFAQVGCSIGKKNNNGQKNQKSQQKPGNKKRNAFGRADSGHLVNRNNDGAISTMRQLMKMKMTKKVSFSSNMVPKYRSSPLLVQITTVRYIPLTLRT